MGSYWKIGRYGDIAVGEARTGSFIPERVDLVSGTSEIFVFSCGRFLRAETEFISVTNEIHVKDGELPGRS